MLSMHKSLELIIARGDTSLVQALMRAYSEYDRVVDGAVIKIVKERPNECEDEFDYP